MLHPMRLTRGMQRFLIKIRMPQTVDKKLFSPEGGRIAFFVFKRALPKYAIKVRKKRQKTGDKLVKKYKMSRKHER